MNKITVNGEDFLLRLTTKGCVNLESRLGHSPVDVFLAANDNKMPMMKDMVVILHEMLQPMNHGITLEKTYSLLDQMMEEGTNVVDIMNLIIDCFRDAGFVPSEDETDPN